MNNIPMAFVTATRSRDGTWGLRVDACPFCGDVHHHGGDNGAIPVVGTRVPHCAGRGTPGEYELVLSKTIEEDTPCTQN